MFNLTKEYLEEEHTKKEKRICQIAKEINVPNYFVRDKLVQFKIPIKDWYTIKANKILTKEFLIKEYVSKEGVSINSIAQKIGYSSLTIKKKLREFNLIIKSSGKIRKNKPKPKGFGEKISKLTKGKPKHTEESKKKISQSLKGHIFSKERNEKISKALTGIKRGPKTQEHIQKVLSKIQVSPNLFEKKCLDYLALIYPSKFVYTGNGDLIVAGHSVDAHCKELNIVALFHGNYFHCNPKIYKANYYNSMLKKTAQEIWNRDNLILAKIKEAGYQVIVIWEKDLKELYKTKGIKNEKIN